MDFPLADTAYRFRPLKRVDPKMVGWDVYAFQTALLELGYELPKSMKPNGKPDSILGDETAALIWFYQGKHGLKNDGIAGTEVQPHMGRRIAKRARREHNFPEGIPHGSFEHESSLLFGNHSALRPDGSRDVGFAQCNTDYHAIGDGFDVRYSVRELCGQIAAKHLQYARRGEVGDQRAWELACGSWNAPAFTNWIAGIRDTSALEPGPDSRAKIEAYIEDVTAYAFD